MTQYVIRRILLMVPTLFGISFVVWLVMALSPGRPGAESRAMGDAQANLGKDAVKEAQKDPSIRIFRRENGLDRPMFLNLWWQDLTAEFMREEVRVASAPIEEVGVEQKREATERLEDYGLYSVPALVELLESTTGDEQSNVVSWLTANSIRIPILVADPDAETLREQEEWMREGAILKEWKWGSLDATPEERAPIVAKWREWYDENRERWDYSGVRVVGITLTDTQFGTYWGRLLRGSLGTSHIFKQPVGGLVLERMKVSLALNVTALLIAYFLAVPIGIFGAVTRGSWIDRTSAIVLFALYSLPNFFVGTLLIQYFASGEFLQWFPSAGFESEDTLGMSTFGHLKDVLWHITLPLICLVYPGLATLSRYARSGMLDVIRSDYVRTARAKGLSGFVVVAKHVVRNGILPIITLLGTSLPVLIGGSVAIEYIFNINGMGLLMINSIFQKDFNVVMGVQLMVGFLVMVGILISDVTYALLDPRISLK
jgi:peptide/nickel transport system permease protein